MAKKVDDESLEAQMQQLQIGDDDDAFLEEAMKLAAAEKKELEFIGGDLPTERNNNIVPENAKKLHGQNTRLNVK